MFQQSGKDLIQKYYDAVDSMTELFGVSCACYYPTKKVICTNCIFNPATGKSQNIYNDSGPIPFYSGTCPNCHGNGKTDVSSKEVITLRVYYSKKDWVKTDAKVDVSQVDVQVYGHLSDLPKLRRADKILINAEQEAYDLAFYKLVGEPIFHGFGKKKYFIAYLKKIA